MIEVMCNVTEIRRRASVKLQKLCRWTEVAMMRRLTLLPRMWHLSISMFAQHRLVKDRKHLDEGIKLALNFLTLISRVRIRPNPVAVVIKNAAELEAISSNPSRHSTHECVAALQGLNDSVRWLGPDHPRLPFRFLPTN